MNDKYSNIYLQILLTLAFLQELMDKLSGTSAYNHSLKQSAKRLQSELDKIINRDMSMVWGVDDDSLYKHIEYLKGLISELSTITADSNGIIALMIQSYKAQPEAVCEALNIKLLTNTKKN